MTTQLSQIPRPQASRFDDKKKLFLVPNYVLPPDAPAEGQELLGRYWSEVRDSIANLERSLGAVTRVYHEFIYLDGDDGLSQIEMMNPSAGPFIRAICQSTAQLHALEDAELIHEHTDWQRILTIGPMSRKVTTAAIEGYQSTLETRYANVAEKIAGDLAEGQTAALFIREDHRVQFPPDIQVFFVAPRALDPLKRWLESYMNPPAPAPQD